MNKTKTKIGILSVCAVALSYMALSPVLADIGAEFVGVSETMVQMIITLPSLMFIISSPISGFLMGYINKKVIALGSLCCYLVGGLLPFFFNSSIWELLAGSVIIGLGSGFMMPLLNGYIVQYFKKEEQASLMGLNATCTALGALFFIFVGGQLAKLGWRYSYLVFLGVIGIIVLVMVCLPAGEPQRLVENGDLETDARKNIEKDKVSSEQGLLKSSSQFEMNPYIFGLFSIGILYFILQNAFNTNSSAFVVSILGKGAAVASIITMANTIGGIIGGAMFKGLVMHFRNHIETVTLIAVGIGFLLPFFIPNFVALLIGSILVGYGYAVFNAGGTFMLAQNTRPDTNAFTVSVYLALINLGGALSPIIVNACSGILGDGVSYKYLFSGIVILVVGMYSLFLNTKKNA